MEIERSIFIARPPAEVFASIADIRNDPTWHTDVLEVESSSDVVGMGTVFSVKVKPSMGVSEGTMTVSRYKPGRLFRRSAWISSFGTLLPTGARWFRADPPRLGTESTRCHLAAQ